MWPASGEVEALTCPGWMELLDVQRTVISARYNMCMSVCSSVSIVFPCLKEYMSFVASLWGGGGIDMTWLDGVTGYTENCDISQV